VAKQLSSNDPTGDDNRAGIDLLRALAGYPTRSVHLSKHTVHRRIVLIQRDASGRVTGSTERIEMSEYTDLIGEYLD